MGALILKYIPAAFAGVFITTLIVIFVLSLFVWTKRRQSVNYQIAKKLKKANSGMNEAQKIISEGYLCRWNPKTDPKFAWLFSPIYKTQSA